MDECFVLEMQISNQNSFVHMQLILFLHMPPIYIIECTTHLIGATYQFGLELVTDLEQLSQSYIFSQSPTLFSYYHLETKSFEN